MASMRETSGNRGETAAAERCDAPEAVASIVLRVAVAARREDSFGKERSILKAGFRERMKVEKVEVKASVKEKQEGASLVDLFKSRLDLPVNRK